ncbi:molybdopterin-guanine dinucleotide biosynthesis protein A [Paenibacillus curdlanolyticus YK9]|uniref:Molybdopterin-guanine dinucleotide biosynthesis protein A n=1 Tax=Paenibacillus curdlanolyticus YK9 TaxID=717606 RepID=E0I5G4_9BACL|nr:molybdenum cofactor guanylyltransferase [Paenibacillus curdlanolyticus]EFM12206.1 molybdopterin-guanine dinucleotide biosynthesis protein A [Paenibacillus curdlanolyticus YK9]
MLSGVILAGGSHHATNGENRAFLVLDGETLLERQIREMSSCCSEITIVTNDPRPFLRAVDREIRIITDSYAGKGMLSGIHAGLSLSKNRHVWILGCHMPFPSADAALLLAAQKPEGAEAVMPWINSSAHPLHGIYDRSCVDKVGTLLDGGSMKVSALLHTLQWSEVYEPVFTEHGISSRFIESIHDAQDHERLITQISQCG